ncbi:LytTR family transcriptional regulator DNA-binding domain-containing protein [Sphingobacterium faecium]|uniref:LytTR family transcriptional regulator DNA-binding domain-containing protein n=1 Tax=Sphingobacterium faecium TaxID=34087 RepID=UPI003D35F7E5
MKKILIRTKEKTFLIGDEDILYCKAAGAYSVIYLTHNNEIITSVNLLNLFERLKCFPSIFRVSQSHLININFVRCIHHSTKEIELSNSFLLSYTIKIKELEQALLSMVS